jgi:hypothetical protein
MFGVADKDTFAKAANFQAVGSHMDRETAMATLDLHAREADFIFAYWGNPPFLTLDMWNSMMSWILTPEDFGQARH